MILIFDLDGTLIPQNSFRLWTLFMLRARFPHLSARRRIAISGEVACLSLAKKTGLISHVAVKARLQQLWRCSTANDGGAAAATFSKELKALIRPEFRPLVEGVSAGKSDGIFASAAAGEYAIDLAHACGFKHVLTSPCLKTSPHGENVGEQKKASILAVLAAKGWQDRFRLLFTDHLDDLPSIKICHAVGWFGSPSDQAVAQRAAPHVRISQGIPVALQKSHHEKRAPTADAYQYF